VQIQPMAIVDLACFLTLLALRLFVHPYRVHPVRPLN
jgi:hypothetical protein